MNIINIRNFSFHSSPIKTSGVGPTLYTRTEGMGWEDVPSSIGDREGSGGSTTISASSSPAPDDEPEPPRIEDVSPRKKPRKQLLVIFILVQSNKLQLVHSIQSNNSHYAVVHVYCLHYDYTSATISESKRNYYVAKIHVVCGVYMRIYDT